MAKESQRSVRIENQTITATITATPMIAATVPASQRAPFTVFLGMGVAAA
jgi:hypothetical protein